MAMLHAWCSILDILCFFAALRVGSIFFGMSLSWSMLLLWFSHKQIIASDGWFYSNGASVFGKSEKR
jgi:hypothetical protein